MSDPIPTPPTPPTPPPQGQFGDDNPFGFPPAATASAAGGTPPPEDTTPANYQIGSKLPKVILIKIPPHSLSFDEQHFLHMLGSSISLTRDEKNALLIPFQSLNSHKSMNWFAFLKKSAANLPNFLLSTSSSSKNWKNNTGATGRTSNSVKKLKQSRATISLKPTKSAKNLVYKPKL